MWTMKSHVAGVDKWTGIAARPFRKNGSKRTTNASKNSGSSPNLSCPLRAIAGHGFSYEQGWYPFTPANTPTAHWSFLYSLYVAGVYGLFGVHPLAVRLAQAVLGGLLLPWLVYRLGRRLYSPGSRAAGPCWRR